MTAQTSTLRRPLSGLIVLLALAMALPAGAEEPLPYLRGSALVHGNLTIVPLYAKDRSQPSGEFLTFEQASKKKLVRVTELNGSTSDAEVNAVHVTNKSDKPVFILAGEVILGGKQDRVIAKDTVVPAKTKKLQVAVFCVEQGRWDGRQAQFSASGKIGHGDLREKAIFASDQGQVWEEVSKTNKKLKVAPSSGTYKASLKKAEADATPYVKALLPKLKADTRTVGVVVAIDGEVVSLDAFANPNLFAQVRDKLVVAYALEAANADGAGKDATVSTQKVDGFFAEVRKAEKGKREVKSGGADNYFFDSETIQGNESKSPAKKSLHKFYKVK
jgi:hypothetical protein